MRMMPILFALLFLLSWPTAECRAGFDPDAFRICFSANVHPDAKVESA